jgi:hypothetical protein
VAELSFDIRRVEWERFAAVPLLAFGLHVETDQPGAAIENVLLQTQIRIEPARRHYSSKERGRLKDLFGEAKLWSRSLKSLLWTHASLNVPAFLGSCDLDLPVPSSFDFNLAATKYFYGLDDQDIPLRFLFSGTVFLRNQEGNLELGHIDWGKEAAFGMPARVWRAMMDHYYPDSTWLHLHRDAFERLYRYKRDRQLPTWEQALDLLLEGRDGLAELE